MVSIPNGSDNAGLGLANGVDRLRDPHGEGTAYRKKVGAHLAESFKLVVPTKTASCRHAAGSVSAGLKRSTL